jgi:signal peptidase
VKSILNKLISIVLGIAIIVVVAVSIYAFLSRGKGYASLFGYAALAVKSESMMGDNADSFNKGDVIFIKVLGKEEKRAVSVGQVVTFYDLIDVDGDGEYEVQLNTHRITKVLSDGAYVVTKGDNAQFEDTKRSTENIVGVYTGKLPWVGNLVMFIQSKWGFLFSIVLPSLLIVCYCLKDFFASYKDYTREKKAKSISDIKEIIYRELKSLGR